MTFEEIYTRFRRPVWALARRLTESDDEALDEMRSLRQTLRQLALAERPPEVLDQMVRPLRRAGRPMRQRWVAAALVAAAAVVRWDEETDSGE